MKPTDIQQKILNWFESNDLLSVNEALTIFKENHYAEAQAGKIMQQMIRNKMIIKVNKRQYKLP